MARGLQREVREMLTEACELEVAYARDTVPRGMLGLSAALCEQYMRFISDRRAQQIGLAPIFGQRRRRRTSSKPASSNTRPASSTGTDRTARGLWARHTHSRPVSGVIHHTR